MRPLLRPCSPSYVQKTWLRSSSRLHRYARWQCGGGKPPPKERDWIRNFRNTLESSLLRGDCCPPDQLLASARCAAGCTRFANCGGPNRPLEGKSGAIQGHRIGGGAEKLRLSKPLVYVEGLCCFSESEVAERFNLLINRLRR